MARVDLCSGLQGDDELNLAGADELADTQIRFPRSC